MPRRALGEGDAWGAGLERGGEPPSAQADAFPARHRAHKYWGRKPANVVSGWIERFSRPGDLVVDPFSGSAVTLVEAARLGRRALGFDLSPFAVRLGRALLRPPAAEAFVAAARLALDRARLASSGLFDALCDRCGSWGEMVSLRWDGPSPRRVHYRCGRCRASADRAPSPHDLSLALARPEPPRGAPDDQVFFGWQMRKLKRGGVTRWSELFTARNFAAAAHLREAALAEPDARVREWLLLTLTASLAQLTRMIADGDRAAGGPSWKINCYWLPPRWQELNPFWYFQNRVKKSAEALRDLAAQGAPFERASVEVNDSRVLPLGNGECDFIFTDPPYGGEGVQYGELSMLWCLWLGERQALEREIAFNPVRGLGSRHYAAGLDLAMAECRRVLAPRGKMTVTFANKDAAVWQSLLDACEKAGLRLESSQSMRRSAPSLTESNAPRAPKEDVLLTFARR